MDDVPEGTLLAELVKLGRAVEEVKKALLASVPLERVLERLASMLARIIDTAGNLFRRWLG